MIRPSLTLLLLALGRVVTCLQGANPDDGPADSLDAWAEASVAGEVEGDDATVSIWPEPDGSQVVLDAPSSAAAAKTKLVLESKQDSTVFYPQQAQAIWPKVWNKGPAKADKLVLESPELAQWDLSVAGVYASCPGTRSGSARIRCEWNKADGRFHKWAKITLRRGGRAASGRISVPLTLTSRAR
ncbi:hypothetical protein CDD83_1443 [Cordyceps sp. RAO-2017]|nr:hypothetical protein CDD83_1443 [Cordyceps sp. RAO-2017]